MDKFLTLLHRFYHPRRTVSAEKSVIEPEREWKRILLGALVIGCLVLFLNIYLYREVNKGDIFIDASAIKTQFETLDKEEIQSLVKFYKDTAVKAETIRRSRPAFVDPSL